jgi:hypothetical protein
VADVVGEAHALHYGAPLFKSAHGIAELEISGHLTEDEWRTTPEDLIATLAEMAANHHPTTPTH